MRHIPFLFAFSLMLSAVLLARAEEPESGKLDLQLCFEVGQTFRCVEKLETKDTEWFGTAEASVVERKEWTKTLEVLAVGEAGVATMKVLFDRRAVSHDDGDGPEDILQKFARDSRRNPFDLRSDDI